MSTLLLCPYPFQPQMVTAGVREDSSLRRSN